MKIHFYIDITEYIFKGSSFGGNIFVCLSWRLIRFRRKMNRGADLRDIRDKAEICMLLRE